MHASLWDVSGLFTYDERAEREMKNQGMNLLVLERQKNEELRYAFIRGYAQMEGWKIALRLKEWAEGEKPQTGDRYYVGREGKRGEAWWEISGEGIKEKTFKSETVTEWQVARGYYRD